MKKGTSITLLSIISILIACMLVVTFARFPVGAKENFNGVLGAIELDYGVESSSVYTLELDKESDDPEDIREVLDTLSFRLNELGYKNSVVKAVKNTNSSVYDIRIEVNASTNEYNKPDTDALASDIAAVAAYGKLEFYGAATSDPTETIFNDIDEPIESVEYGGYDSTSGSYLVSIKFTKDAYAELEKNMAAGDFYLKVSIGDELVLLSGSGESGKVSESYFTNRTIALVSNSEASAKQMVLQIKSGGLDYKYEVSSVSTISSTMGNVGLLSVIVIAAIIVCAIVAFFVIYKGYGLVSLYSMLIFILVDLFMFIAVPGIKVSVGSIAGVLLATILAIDGLIIVIKRISEEYASGKTVKSAVRIGFQRALVPTITSGIVSGVIALSLLLLTSGQVYSFAVAFGIGAVLATISSLLFVRLFVALFLPCSKDGSKFFNLKRGDK